ARRTVPSWRSPFRHVFGTRRAQDTGLAKGKVSEVNLPAPRSRTLLILALTVALLASLFVVGPSGAATSDVGYAGPSTSGAGKAPTGEKPESKLWWNDGRWWASMFAASSGTWHIWYLDRTAKAWVDTGTPIDNRPDSRADTLWDGSHLYVGSHVKAASNTTETTGNPARLYRFTYNPVTRTYTLASAFPAATNNTASQTLTIDQYSTG